MSSSGARRGTVGVLDEDVWYVRHLSELLQAHGTRVMLLSASAMALDVLARAQCDVVLTERTTNGLSGSALCTALRERCGRRRPWFVLLTASAEEPEDGAAFDVRLRKPIEDDVLVRGVLDAVEARRQQLEPDGPKRRR